MTQAVSDTLNKNNVFITFERIIVSKSNNLKVEILLSELNGYWYVGYEYQKGSAAVGDYGSGAYPSKSPYSKPFTSRQAAINYQLKQFELDRKEVYDAARRFRQPSLF
jgi:hypothetical protein